MPVCLGIDPGLARLGYGAVMMTDSGLCAVGYGCIETTPAMKFTERLLKLHTVLQEKITALCPDFVSVEKLFFGKNARTAEYVYQARGVIMLLIAENNLPFIELTPNSIKRSVTGNIKAKKHDIQAAVREILSLEETPRPDDTADALAAAVAGLSLYEGG
ncbi:MAG: crossover junction endodeoxyribonuclease RuvC [Synergistaceae bacterium]|nr:crossover junction endodeoxyribonuclease RuvC [Synergistaceae bacterium]